MHLHQTQHFENLLQLERKTISLLRAHGLQNCQETPIKVGAIQSEVQEIEGDIEPLLAKLAFISVQDGCVVPLTHQIFTEEVQSLSCQVLIKFKSVSETKSVEDIVGAFKWYVSSMMTLKDHLKFEDYSENPLVIKYSSTSESAARAL